MMAKSGGAKGKAKGSAFERDICRTLTEYVTGNKRPEVFWRTAGSGGKASIERKLGIKNAIMAGDICCVNPRKKKAVAFTSVFSVECKFYKSFSFDSLLLQEKNLVLNWWFKCVKEARASDKQPLLIFKKNNYPAFVAIFKSFYDEIIELSKDKKIPKLEQHVLRTMTIDYPYGSPVVICKMDDFFRWFTPYKILKYREYWVDANKPKKKKLLRRKTKTTVRRKTLKWRRSD